MTGTRDGTSTLILLKLICEPSYNILHKVRPMFAFTHFLVTRKHVKFIYYLCTVLHCRCHNPLKLLHLSLSGI